MNCNVLFLLSVLVSVTAGVTAAYHPTDVFLFNCGDTSNNVDNSGRNWTVESRQILSSNLVNASFTSEASYQKAGVSRIPYMKARIFRSEFTYSFPVTPGSIFLRLYFYPTQYKSGFDAVNSFFSVKVNGFTLLRNFNADSTVQASIPLSNSLIKEFIIPVHQTLNLTFTPSKNLLAFVNGIEIVSMPDRFYSKGGFDNVLRNVSSDVDFQIDNSTAFESVHRLNVGGQIVNEVDDSGMFRRWLSDDSFGNSGSIVNVPGVKINYTEKTPAYVAPYDVYATSRLMGNSSNLMFNLTGMFLTVDAGYNYLVRLHFCETLPQVTKAGQRVFSIFVEDKMAKKETDVIRLSGGPRIPMYLDFSVYVGFESGMIQPELRLDLVPLKDTNQTYYDAILSGVEILKLNDSDGNLARPNPELLVSTDSTPDDSNVTPPIKGKPHVLVIILIVVGSVIGLATFIVIIMLLIRQMKRKKNKKENSVIMFKLLLKQYIYAELKKITKSFSHTVGKGGFGTVYRGNLSNGRTVAVKVLKDLKGNSDDFINKVTSMSQTSHVNIVSLLGFCYEGSKRAIISEFLEHGSLDQFISRNKSLTPNVTTLYGIALGIARGLEYLHYGCKTRIVHFDIKPQNILLDDNFCPKVADFGLAKLCEKRESILSLIDTRGTIGYIAPEVVSRMYGGISHKSDVYSYGMLVLDMIGARNKVETTTCNGSTAYFPDWIYKDLENGDQTWIIGDEINEEDNKIVKKMILVSLWCIRPCPSDRPPMNKVVEMIEGSLDALELPPKPSRHISTELVLESSSLSDGQEAEKQTQTLDSTII